ncbi:MAG TPA: bifunctional diaminohydroxyphosphoribosylaminopyrimidine deaminase/5-amino-6-(5-phosphoribosylamino)uracil reductase RibD [Steroidobacteraceae bacterium]|jgi:diaminohydroxyphosphoribosylaminopyrimidine deaminase / 5-amino-6-(5-phosphoribosylamino)uracil reductase|nr:bifunctional diaminohydroxyphosphoribosylaminopyrimidine deaminase/5-amino-6-(5-phosphoribosylamino)uracil reductase RibD [Steroidobacteraceae bacterium]
MSTPPQPPGSGMFSDFDRFAMQRALTLAARGLETTDPNPRVGCVIAQRGRVVGEGWHERAGEAHAEIAALRAAGNQAVGATVYVTLEPCSHHGRTPPCVEALIAARVARVLIAARDPNPQVDGKGAAALRAAGIAVESGLMEGEAIDLNAGFFRRMLTGRPLVRVKLAMSLDGRTALASGESRWITGEAARQDVQHWRARSSAILTGIGTVLADDPRLDVRLPVEAGAARRQPLRIVLDSQLRTPPGARLFETPGEVLILTTLTAPEDPRALELTSRGARLESLPLEGERVALAPVLDRLAELELNEVLVEAGAILAGEMLRQALVDELLLYVGLRLLGPSARALVTIPPLARLADAPSFSLFDMQPVGDDLRLRLRPGGSARAQR